MMSSCCGCGGAGLDLVLAGMSCFRLLRFSGDANSPNEVEGRPAEEVGVSSAKGGVATVPRR
jgi:hypothetical protein